MTALSTVRPDSRNAGDEIQVFDDFNGNNTRQYIGKIVKITKAFITVKHPLSDTKRFHRKNGQVVGYSFPGYCRIVAADAKM